MVIVQGTFDTGVVVAEEAAVGNGCASASLPIQLTTYELISRPDMFDFMFGDVAYRVRPNGTTCTIADQHNTQFTGGVEHMPVRCCQP